MKIWGTGNKQMQKISVLNVFQEIKEKFENINKEKESKKKLSIAI